MSLVGAGDAADFALTANDGRLALTATAQDSVIGFVTVAGNTHADAAASLAPALKHVMQWERCLRLQNHRSAMDRSKVDFVYVERLDDGGEDTHDGTETVLAYTCRDGRWRKIQGRFRVRNRTEQTLFVVLAYFSEAYGIHILSNEPIAPGDTWMTVWGDGPTDHFYLEDGVDQSIERFKLIVATEKVDDFLLAQPPLTLGDEYGVTRATESVHAAAQDRAHERVVHQGLPHPRRATASA